MKKKTIKILIPIVALLLLISLYNNRTNIKQIINSILNINTFNTFDTFDTLKETSDTTESIKEDISQQYLFEPTLDDCKKNSDGFFDEDDIEYKKRYSFKNLELFYQYQQFQEQYKVQNLPKYFEENSDYINECLSKTCFIFDSYKQKREVQNCLNKQETFKYNMTDLIDLTKATNSITTKKFQNIVLWSKYNSNQDENHEQYIKECQKVMSKVKKLSPESRVFIISNQPTKNNVLANNTQEYYKGHYIDCSMFVKEDNAIDEDNSQKNFYETTMLYAGFYTELMELKNSIFVPEKHISLDETTKEKRIIYMTFDDGPNTNTEELLSILGKYDVKATFFVTGQMLGSIYTLRKMYEAGHTVAAHTFSHEYSIYESAETYFRDLYKIECLIRKEIGEFSDIIRFPGGSGNSISNKYNKGIMANLANDVEDMGYVYYDWNASSGDGAHIDSQTTLINAINALNKPRDKYIILFHEKKSTIDIIESFIQHAQLMNFNFLPLLRNSYIVHGYQK